MKCNPENRKYRTRCWVKQEKRRRARTAVGGCGRGQREQKTAIGKPSWGAAWKSGNKHFLFLVEKSWGSSNSYFPFSFFFYLTNPLLLRQFLRSWDVGHFKRVNCSSLRWETNLHTSDEQKCRPATLCIHVYVGLFAWVLQFGLDEN